MPSLYDKAALRCEAAILRAWPAWKQAHLTDDERPAFEAYRDACKAHLQTLRDAIVRGGTPDIDRGWPQSEIAREPVLPAEEPQREAAPGAPFPEPPTIVENPETQARLAEATAAHEETQARLRAALDALTARKEEGLVPPAEIADLIRLNENYERTNERLVEGYRNAMQRAEIARTQDGTFEGKSTTEWLRKAERYDSAIRWNKGRGVETL